MNLVPTKVNDEDSTPPACLVHTYILVLVHTYTLVLIRTFFCMKNDEQKVRGHLEHIITLQREGGDTISSVTPYLTCFGVCHTWVPS